MMPFSVTTRPFVDKRCNPSFNPNLEYVIFSVSITAFPTKPYCFLAKRLTPADEAWLHHLQLLSHHKFFYCNHTNLG